METYLTTEPFRGIFRLRRKTTWYSIKDGNWLDPSTWLSNRDYRSGVTSPQPGDDVYINHSVLYDRDSLSPIAINNLFISGKFSIINNSNGSITINGNLQATGIIDLSGGNSFNLILNGYYNYIPSANLIAGATSIVTYSGVYTQYVMNLSYRNLSLSSSMGRNFSTKYLTSDLTLPGSFTINACTVDLLNYNLTANGTANAVAPGSSIIRSGTGNTATLTLNTTSTLENNSIINVGNTDVYFTGNISYIYNSSITARNIYFTNSASIGTITSPTQQWFVYGNIVVYSGKTISSYQEIYLEPNSTIEGVDNTAIFNQLRNDLIYFWPYTAMTTSGGTFTLSSTGGVGYSFAGNYTIPYTSTWNLSVYNGSGIKSLSGNTTCGGTFFLSGSDTFDPVSYSITAASASFAYGTNITRSGTSGKITLGSMNTMDTTTLNLNGTDIEFQGDIQYTYGVSISAGNIIFSKTTSAQQLGTTVNSSNRNFNTQSSAVRINSGTTLILMPYCEFITAGLINGVDSTSIFDVRSQVTYSNTGAPMAVGKLYCNQAANKWIYASGNQDIAPPNDPTNPGYYNLELSGSGTTKRLLGNVSVKNTYTLDAGVTLNSNGFALTNP